VADSARLVPICNQSFGHCVDPRLQGIVWHVVRNNAQFPHASNTSWNMDFNFHATLCIVCYPVGTAMLGESNTLNRSLNFENCYLILGCLKLPQDLMRKNLTHFPIFSMSNNWIPIFSDTPISSFYHPLIMILVILVIQHSSHGRIPILVTNSILHSVQNPLSFWIILVKNGIPIDYYCYGHPQDFCLVEKLIYI